MPRIRKDQRLEMASYAYADDVQTGIVSVNAYGPFLQLGHNRLTEILWGQRTKQRDGTLRCKPPSPFSTVAIDLTAVGATRDQVTLTELPCQAEVACGGSRFDGGNDVEFADAVATQSPLLSETMQRLDADHEPDDEPEHEAGNAAPNYREREVHGLR